MIRPDLRIGAVLCLSLLGLCSGCTKVEDTQATAAASPKAVAAVVPMKTSNGTMKSVSSARSGIDANDAMPPGSYGSTPNFATNPNVGKGSKN